MSSLSMSSLTLFKIENGMNRFTTVTTDARWTKSIGELIVIKGCEWPTKRNIFIWEVVTEIKAFPTRGS